ncbi:LysR family transcriptional regulator [Alteromonas aestuariivivens]|uniref:LysR family transcriptional regulator n=1 Tax=Alteromonas aestuariivivens TaxID=1938339 RepID=A0A3D8M8L4_9ALTE|nr:LysR family transcriptional regulator [Alteromonas aestuariivivens]RDV26003.1 LysR family transcriptional regulator [Alteromonas aestuariivivens]
MAISYRNMLAFIQVADSATFAEAAEKLHLTQPALSSAIKKMESQLGGKLFSRTTRRVQLTPEGCALLPAARRLVGEWDETFEDMQNLFAMQQGKLTIAAMPSFAESYLPGYLKQYRNHWPNIRLRILDIVMEQVIDSVLNGKAEIGFTFEPESLDGLDFIPFFEDRFMAVFASEHPYALQTKISVEELLKCPFIAMNRGSAVRGWTDSLVPEGWFLNIVAETGQLSSVRQFIAQDIGVSVVPQLCREQMESQGLICLPIDGNPLVKRVGMVKASRGSISVAGQALWEQCMANSAV